MSGPTETTSADHPMESEPEDVAREVATLAYQMAGRLLLKLSFKLEEYKLDPCIMKIQSALVSVLQDEFFGATTTRRTDLESPI